MKLAASILTVAALVALPVSADSGTEEATGGLTCPKGQTLASGPVDEAVFSRAASRGIRGEWCERYDELGRAERVGPYRERYPSGALRLESAYLDGRLTGPVVAYHENGAVFLRGVVANGAGQGPLTLHHENGELFWSGGFEDGHLEGRVELRHPDGGLAAETRFQKGREDGEARSFYPLGLGGGVKSHVHVEADAFVGIHRIFDAGGVVIERADRDAPPSDWSEIPPVAASAIDAPAPADSPTAASTIEAVTAD